METKTKQKSKELTVNDFSAEQILSDADFTTFITATVNKLTDRPKLEGNQRYKRGVMDSLRDNGLLQPDKMLVEFDKICMKASALPMQQRDTIDYIIVTSSSDYMKAKIAEHNSKLAQPKPRVKKDGKARSVKAI